MTETTVGRSFPPRLLRSRHPRAHRQIQPKFPRGAMSVSSWLAQKTTRCLSRNLRASTWAKRPTGDQPCRSNRIRTDRLGGFDSAPPDCRGRLVVQRSSETARFVNRTAGRETGRAVCARKLLLTRMKNDGAPWWLWAIILLGGIVAFWITAKKKD